MRHIEQECVRLWQEAIVKMYAGHCLWCMQYHPECCGHHIIKRGYYLTKFEVMNGASLCPACHAKAEKHHDKFILYLKHNWGGLYNWHEKMRPKAKQATNGWSTDELKEIKKYLRSL